MNVNYPVIPAKAGIQPSLKKDRFPIPPSLKLRRTGRSGMTSVWKTFLLYAALLYGIFNNGIRTAHADIEIKNPLGDQTKSITALITSIIDQLTPVAVVIAIFAIVVVGFQFVLAAVQGESGKITQARKNLMWVLVGVGVIVSAELLATAVEVFFKNV